MPEEAEEAGFRPEDDCLAVVGYAARFPGAADPDAFWELLKRGGEPSHLFSDEELRAAGIPEALISHTAAVKTGFRLEGAEDFDAGFFGYTPGQARSIDPQQRLLLELAWEALEDAGVDPERWPGAVGVYSSASPCTYARPDDLVFDAAAHQAGFDVGADYPATRVSYKLGLTGPSLNVQTACSSSLVATHLACQGLLNFECDLALAGGVSIHFPQVGYIHHKGHILSPDGHCRAFDEAAEGTAPGRGGALLALKRLADARADGDHIRAVIRGTAVNNDGRRKAGYTAPAAEGQRQVIAAALAVAGVPPTAIGLLEGHGTGTPVGDAIELSALSDVFGEVPPGAISLGSVKTNIGHLDAAAGVAGLLKAVLCVQHAAFVPSLHFQAPNAAIADPASPLRVETRCRPWPQARRYAGVSSFGMGGTNAHVVLEGEAQPNCPVTASADMLFVLSARDPIALRAARDRLADRLAARPDLDLADVAYTLQTGRRGFDSRYWTVARDRDALIALLRTGPDPIIDVGPTGASHLDVEVAKTLADLTAPSSDADRRKHLLRIGELWAQGAAIEWTRLAPQPRRRVPLPTYPFQRTRLERLPQERPAPGPVARQVEARALAWTTAPDDPGSGPSHARAGDSWLLLGLDASETFAERLRADGAQVDVIGEDSPGLIERLKRHNLASRRVIVLVGDRAAGLGTPEPRLPAILRWAAAASAQAQVKVALVGHGLYCVTGEETIDPARGLAPMLMLAASQEAAGLETVVLDLPHEDAAAGYADRIIADVAGSGAGRFLAYRGRARFVPTYRELQCDRTSAPLVSAPGEPHLVFGGFGPLGVALARRLLAQGARVVLAGRRPPGQGARVSWAAPPGDAGLGTVRLDDDAVVHGVLVDVADAEAVAAVVARVAADLGPIAGVYYLVADSRHPSAHRRIVDGEAADLTAQVRAKGLGFSHVMRALAGHAPRVQVAFSSAAAVLAGPGRGFYGAANLHMEHLAEAAAQTGPQAAWTTIGWDPWRETELAADGADGLERFTVGIEEGFDMLQALAGLPRPLRAVVTVGSLAERWARWVEPVAPRAPPPHTVVAAPSGASSELEAAVAEIWRKAIGVETIGLDDGFFDLGGDSLMAVQILDELEALLGLELDLEAVLQAGVTVRSLAAHLVSQLAERLDAAGVRDVALECAAS